MRKLYIIVACLGFSFMAYESLGQTKKVKTSSKTAKTIVSKTDTIVKAKPNPVTLDQINTQNTQPIIDQKPNGSVNWTEQYIEAKGSSVIDTVRFKNVAQARAMATRGAVVVAQRNLLEIINGVQVTSETTVQDMITTSDFIYTKVDGVIKGAQILGQPQENYGMMEVTMRVPMYANNGLASAVYDEVANATSKMRVAETNTANPTSETTTNEAEPKLAFNFKGKKFDPAMFPVITDENNNLLLDLSKIYDPKKGQFPKYVNLAKEVFQGVGFQKGVDILDVVSAQDGKIAISNASKKKVNWSKIGNVASKIGKFLLMLI